MKYFDVIVGSLEIELRKKPINRNFAKMKTDINELHGLFESHPLTTVDFLWFIKINTDTFYKAVEINYTGRYDEIIRTGIKYLSTIYNDMENDIKQTFI
ncbi:hypothetical protein [Bacillus phage vB_Bpu_PumA1]|uniref:Uncharacterized protein n=1 Tax=Bacillus phage vB_Bpu_PumA1 TaxID=2662127 RepID=A0A5Q2WCR0_9CAUD|nr:hypothetical protein H3020_gp02 [Bacillus phage vB_Bpu_PumA1]QGH74195.1 hypothetical protein [Bacillus phage vB_Bpu_PumA1]